MLFFLTLFGFVLVGTVPVKRNSLRYKFHWLGFTVFWLVLFWEVIDTYSKVGQ